MSEFKKAVRLSVLSLTAIPVLALGACGDGGSGGWQAVPYEGVPYTHERTAGKGVTFVRAAMLPPKEAKVEPMMQETKPVETPAPEAKAPPPPRTEPITAGDSVFEKKQAK